MVEAAPARRGVPATPKMLTVEQPDGYKLNVYLRGDEHHHFYITADGYHIDKNKKGYFCYMMQDARGHYVVSRRRAHNQSDRSRCELRFLKRIKPQDS